MAFSIRQRIALAARAAACALLLAACGTGDPPSTGPAEVVPCTTLGTQAAFKGGTYDYDPRRSPEELCQLSELIVSGTVAGVREGRTTFFPGNSQITGSTSRVLVITDVTVVRGQRAPDSDGSVYLELYGAGHADPAYYSRLLPVGASVVAYLVTASDGLPREGIDVAMEKPDAGRPAGQALYLPANPQSLALQIGGNEVFWPLIGARADGRIEDTLPGGHLIAD